MTTLAPAPVTPRPESLIATLAGLFPVFIIERWQPPRPLKVGIDPDLIATGVLMPWEVQSALRSYVTRRTYFVATVAGAPGFDLDGNPADEVTPQAAGWARAMLACMDARAAAHPAREAKKAAEGRAWIEARRAARVAAKECKAAPASFTSQALRKKTHVRPSGGVHRLSLADLRAAALARRTGIANVPVRPRGLEETASE
jgi:sRNA-binding protein